MNIITTERIRVGEPASPVYPGDPAPGGGYYRAGMFSPSADELGKASLDVGIGSGIVDTTLPFFRKDGVIDPKSYEEWRPQRDLLVMDVLMDDTFPKYSAPPIVSAISSNPIVMKRIGVKAVSLAAISSSESSSDETGAGNKIIIAKTSSRNGTFTGGLLVFPNFYRYTSVPITPPGYYPRGFSVAEYAVYHAIGHIAYARLYYDGQMDLIGKFFTASGWSKFVSAPLEDASFLGVKKRGNWKRNAESVYLTELSKYSPTDDFAETFALYFTNRKYLSTNKGRYSVMSEVMEFLK